MCAHPYQGRRSSCYSPGTSGVPQQVSAGSGPAARALQEKHLSLPTHPNPPEKECNVLSLIKNIYYVYNTYNKFTLKLSAEYFYNSIKGKGRELLSSVYNSTSRSLNFNSEFLFRIQIFCNKRRYYSSTIKNLLYFWHPYPGYPGYLIQVIFSDSNQIRI